MKKRYFPIAMTLLAVFIFLYLFPGNITFFRRMALETQFSGMITSIGWEFLLAIAILVATMLFGRLYCAYLCPAGLTQHLFTRIGKRIGSVRLGYKKTLPALSFAVMATVVLYIILTGCVSFLGPAPGFGMLMQTPGELIRRGTSSTWKFLAEDPRYTASIVLVFVLFVALPLFRGRVFCNRICPVGILLGWVNLLPGRRLRIVPEKCAACGQCAKACPVSCIDAENKTIYAERCVECWECANACKLDAVEKEQTRSPARRSFLSRGAMTALGGMYVFSQGITRPGGFINGKAFAPDLPSPPGSDGTEQHALRCIGCQACVPVCPVGIIRPHKGRPLLDFRYGYCQYNCTQCSNSCPSGAINPVSRLEKQTIRIARVSLDFGNCVVMTQGYHCGACAEVCPTHAMSMIHHGGENEPPVPDLDPDYCIGCGACYHVCPASPRAITLTALGVHEKSKGVRLIQGSGHEESHDREDEGEERMVDFPF